MPYLLYYFIILILYLCLSRLFFCSFFYANNFYLWIKMKATGAKLQVNIKTCCRTVPIESLCSVLSLSPHSWQINEVKVSTSYHSKPMLFGDSKIVNMPGGRAMSILDRFEEEKRKAKEMYVHLFISILYAPRKTMVTSK